MAVASFAALLDGIRVATAKRSIVDPLLEDGNIMCVFNDLEGKVINFHHSSNGTSTYCSFLHLLTKKFYVAAWVLMS
jgi:hypothetical protein